MSDELVLNGKQYVSSKRAAQQTGYARDYIGQLSRGGMIDAERVGGLWYVSMESLQSYEKNAEIARASAPSSALSKDAESSVVFEGKEYISASRASKITSYNQDYVGQLARGGKIPSRQIGNRWYVDREALVQHKAEKDALLAAVQSESVGLASAIQLPEKPVIRRPEHMLVLPPLTYTPESSNLLPLIPEKSTIEAYPMSNFSEVRPDFLPEKPQAIPVPQSVLQKPAASLRKPVRNSKRRVVGASVGVLTIILVLSVSFVGLKGSSTFASVQKSEKVRALSAGAAQAVQGMGDIIEDWVSPELVYHRGQ